MDVMSRRNKWFEEFSYGFYGVCAGGGMLSAGATHLAITPLDVLKVNMQVNPGKYRGIWSGFRTLWVEQGPSSLWRGWSGKLLGYGVQGGCKFGLYEYFKAVYGATPLLANQSDTTIFFLSSASAQIFADVALCPFEAVKVRVQTQPHFARGLLHGFPKLYAAQGLKGLYRGILPLWGRNLPFSMVMFSTFEHSVDVIYGRVLKKRREECSRMEQLSATCMAGYAAGAVGTIISNPADNIVAALNSSRGSTMVQAAKKIGLVNLMSRSLRVRMILVGPVVTMQWFLYDSIKLFNGLPTSGGLLRQP